MPAANNKKKEFAIIGLNRFGSTLARRLVGLGHRVLAIDINPAAVKEIADEITEAVILDATDEDALREVDITSFNTIIVGISRDFEASALITSTLKKLGIPQVICASNTARHREILLRIGADRVILPEEDSGSRLADALSIPGMLDQLHISLDYSLIEITPPEWLIGKGIDACDDYQVVVLLILRGDQLIINPDRGARFLPDDILVLMGETQRLAEFTNRDE